MVTVVRLDLKEVLRHFKELEDPRSSVNLLHPLDSVIVIAIMAVLAGANGPTAIAKWANMKSELLLRLLDLPNGIPQKDVFRRVLATLKPDAFQACFTMWLTALRTAAAEATGVERPTFAIDGKTLRRSHDRHRNLGALHSVSVWPKPAADEAASAAIEADIDHWVEEDASRSGFDPAAWNAAPRRPSAETAAGSTEGPSAAPREPQPAAFQPAALSAAARAASFQPALLWERFVRKPAPGVSPASDETDEGPDWKDRSLVDALLLLAILNLGLLLLATMVSEFSSWHGLQLVVLASLVAMRTARAGRFRFDKCNQAFAIQAVLLACPLLTK